MFHKKFHRIEDFWEEASFVAWVLGNDPQAAALWETWVPEDEGQLALMQEARSLLQAVKVQEHPITDSHIRERAAAILLSLPYTISPNYKKRSISWGMAAAFTGVVVMLGALLWFTQHPLQKAPATLAVNQEKEMEEVVNRSNNPMAVWLADSSQMVLTPGSMVRFSNRFGVVDREVFLEGKATFTVRQNQSLPFRVNSGDIVTQVLGTTFTVNADRNSDTILVAVQHGKVSVSRLHELKATVPDSEIILSPNQEAHYGKASRHFLKTLVPQPITQVAVKHTTDFIFTDTPLPEVFEKLEKIYAIQLEYDNPGLSQCSLTANLNKEGFYDKLDLICKALRLTYRQTDGQIIISGKGCQEN
jgi:transmembrane sensor